MSYTFKPATGRGHVTTYRNSRFAYVRKNVFGYWRTTDPDHATHVVSVQDRQVHPWTPANAHWF